jgi:hypothetical protein
MARSARIAWAKVKSAFRTAAAASAQPSSAIPCPGCMRSATKQNAADPSRSRLNKFANCLASTRSQPHRGGAVSAFGPTSERRCAASSARSPSLRLRRLAQTASTSRL